MQCTILLTIVALLIPAAAVHLGPRAPRAGRSAPIRRAAAYREPDALLGSSMHAIMPVSNPEEEAAEAAADEAESASIPVADEADEADDTQAEAQRLLAIEALGHKLERAQVEIERISRDYDELVGTIAPATRVAGAAEGAHVAAAAAGVSSSAVGPVRDVTVAHDLAPAAQVAQAHAAHAQSAPVDRVRTPVCVRVLGVGGGGGNTVNRLADCVSRYSVDTLATVAVNTDLQALERSRAHEALLIGAEGERKHAGRGAGGDPSIGREAAEHSVASLAEAVVGADLVFVTAGMGGGTGSGAAPTVARVARESGALAVGVVTRPFGFEGSRRAEQADAAIEALEQETDALVVISNDRLLSQLPAGVSVEDAFTAADDVLRQAICGVAEIVLGTGLINVDFNDLRAVMQSAGPSLVGIGEATSSAAEAACKAIECPLLETAASAAKGIVFNVCGGHQLSLREVHDAADAISAIVDPEANIIFGASIDESLGDKVVVTVIATGIGHAKKPNVPLPPPEAVAETSTASDASAMRRPPPAAHGGAHTSRTGSLVGAARSVFKRIGGPSGANARTRLASSADERHVREQP